MVDFTSTYWKWRILWNTTSFSQFLVSVVFHNNPKCFFKHQQETLFHYIVLKTWFWALIRAKNETNRTCWSQNENAPKDWRSLTLNILALMFTQNCETNLQQLPKTQLWFCKISKQRNSQFLKKRWKFYKSLGLDVIEIWSPFSHEKFELSRIFHFLPSQKWKDFLEGLKVGATSQRLKTKKFRISGKRCKFLQILAWT